jgi:hypothetical protein
MTYHLESKCHAPGYLDIALKYHQHIFLWTIVLLSWKYLSLYSSDKAPTLYTHRSAHLLAKLECLTKTSAASIFLHERFRSSPQFTGPWTLQGVKGVPQGCWPMLTSVLTMVVLSWLNVLWVVGHSWYTWGVWTQQRCSSWHVQIVVPGTYYHTPFKGT